MEEVGEALPTSSEESIVGTDISPFAVPGGGGSSALSGHQCLSEPVLESRVERRGHTLTAPQGAHTAQHFSSAHQESAWRCFPPAV